ncbi:hypothetical protein KQI77_03300 [Clostridium sp. MSJ-8]|uniref:hypothetical protein n=1 Tax=Clostridium sp. MSJ-8 TaxID=2841510 RepID=UPI001C0EEF0D|nr:hypothetical protein [Clostridium sp. MSJ-8]MBU5487190.1 hypothetical protein [Clostridium sp. MSJ-8]
MKNKLLEIADVLNLNCNQTYNVCNGIYRNYNIAIQQFKSVCFLSMPLKLNDNYNSKKLDDFLEKVKTSFSFIDSISYRQYYVSIKYSLGSCKNLAMSLKDLLDFMIDEFSANKLYTCCPDCGESGQIGTFIIKGAATLKCNSCIDKVEIPKETKRQRNILNSSIGLIGTIIGSLIGIILCIVVSYFNTTIGAVISGLFIALCGTQFFLLFGGKLTKLGIFSNFLISSLMVALANYLATGVSIFNIYKKTCTLLQSFASINMFLNFSDIRRIFTLNFTVGYIVFLIVIILTIYVNRKNAIDYDFERL